MDAAISNMLNQTDIASASALQSMSDLQSGSASGKDGNKSLERMQEVGEEFEAVFLSMMIKEMRKSIDGEGLFAGDSGDAYGGMFDMFIGQHLAEGQPLGIGDMLVEQFTRQHGAGMTSEGSQETSHDSATDGVETSSAVADRVGANGTAGNETHQQARFGRGSVPTSPPSSVLSTPSAVAPNPALRAYQQDLSSKSVVGAVSFEA